MSTKTLPLATPDFDANKAALKEFLKSQQELKDYNFDGSALSVILDLLSYNTHMNAFYLNMVGNEAFLNTAVRRNSVVNNAKNLGYTPRSAISAKVILQAEFKPIGEAASTLVIPKGFIVGANSGTEAFVFTTIDDYVVNYNSLTGSYNIDDLTAYEGRRYTHEFTVSATDGNDTVSDVTIDGCSIPNLNVDASTIKVSVMTNGVDYVQYREYDHSLNLSRNSQVYFVREDINEYVNISFGDGVLGFKPPMGSKIRIEYSISSGSVANGLTVFSAAKNIDGTNLVHLATVKASSGGAERESIDSIKYNASRSFESSGRGVTEEDYAFLTRQVYPSAKSVISWGGQRNDPPQHGKVFIAVQPNSGTVIPDEDKATIKDFLRRVGIATIQPEIVDPDYLYVDTNTKFLYSKTRSSKLGGQLETAVKNTIRKYSDNTLSRFKGLLAFSNFLAAIDDTDNGIISNTTTHSLAKRFYVDIGAKESVELKFSNALVRGSVTSSTFGYSSFNDCYFKAGEGNSLNIVNSLGGKETIIVSNIGTINYTTGAVTIDPVIISEGNDKFFDDLEQKFYIRISAKTVDLNIQSTRNQIILIENITVSGKSV